MIIEPPRFELTRVYSDGTSDPPQIVSVFQMPGNTLMERRGFLGVGATALLLLLDGCSPVLDTEDSPAVIAATGEPTIPPPEMEKTPEPTSGSAAAAVPAEVPNEVLKAHSNSISTLTIMPDGKALVSGSLDKTTKLWALHEGKLLRTLGPASRLVLSSAVTPDGGILIIGDDGPYRSGNADPKHWLLPDGKPLIVLEQGAEALAVTPDGQTLISAPLHSGEVALWSLPDMKRLPGWDAHRRFIYALAITPDGHVLASGSGDRTIKLWSIPQAVLLATLEGVGRETSHWDAGVRVLAITSDGRVLASAGASDGTIRLWALPQGDLLKIVEEHEATIRALAIAPDGGLLASGSSDKAINLHSLPDGRILGTMTGHKAPITSLAITPDGLTLASGDQEGVIILWDLERRSFLGFLYDPKANTMDGVTYNYHDTTTGMTNTRTLPCGAPIPRGAVCTCNCVPAAAPASRRDGGGGTLGGRSICTCDRVCTCMAV